MSYENGPGGSRENENNQELTQEDIELRNQIFEDDASMTVLRKVRPNMSLEDFNGLGHDDLNALFEDIAERLKSEENHEAFLNNIRDYDFALVSAAAQELGMEVRTINQLNALDDFSIELIHDKLIDNHGHVSGNGQPATDAHGAAVATATAHTEAEMNDIRRSEAVDAAERHTDSQEEAIFEEEARNNPDADRRFRTETIDALHQNDAWLEDIAKVDPKTVGTLSSYQLYKLKERFDNENGKDYSREKKEETAPDDEKVELEVVDIDPSAETEVKDDDSETREKKKKRGFGKRILAAVVGLGVLAGGLFGFTKSNNNRVRATNPGTTYTTAVEGFSSPNRVEAAGTEAAETDEGIWDASTGNDARGLFADENDPTRVNPDKLGEHNLVDDEEFANEDLSTEQGVKQFKEHFIKVNERQAVNMAMFADYMKNHGGDKYIPESIRGLSGEALEDAIVDNKDGCYTELCKNFEDFVNNANARKGELTAGQYDNYFATQLNPDGVLTKDNIELMKTTTFEKDGTPCFVFENGGITYVVKEVCAQAVTTLDQQPPVTTTPTPEVTTTTTTTTTPETTTTTTTSSTPETSTSTTTSTSETTTTSTSTTPKTTTTTASTTPRTTTTTTTYDNSKSEEGLARGQGGYVSPVEEGPRVTENMDQRDYNPATTTTAEVNFAAQNANSDYAGDINDTPEGAAARQQREEAAAMQADIDQARNNDIAAQPSYVDLNSDSY